MNLEAVAGRGAEMDTELAMCSLLILYITEKTQTLQTSEKVYNQQLEVYRE